MSADPDNTLTTFADYFDGERARVQRVATPLYAVGALAFVGVAMAGLWLGAGFFDNFIATPAARPIEKISRLPVPGNLAAQGDLVVLRILTADGAV